MNKCFNNVELINVFNRRFTFDYFIILIMNPATLFILADQKKVNSGSDLACEPLVADPCFRP